MILMPILLMNLLIGLAVGDIESVRRNAQLKRLAMQVVLHTELERKLPQMWLEKVDKMELIEFPNETKCKKGILDSLMKKWFYNPFSEEEKGNFVSFERKREFYISLIFFSFIKVGIEMVLDSNEDFIVNELDKQKRKLRDISLMMDQQHQLLRLIIQVHNG